MKAKWKIQKLSFLFISGIFLLLVCFSLSSAQLLFSPDIPLATESDLFEERDIVLYNFDSGLSPIFPGPELGIPEGVNLDAFGFSEEYVVFSTDISFEREGIETISERDLTGNDLMGNYAVFLYGQDVGIPEGAEIDAATVLPNGWVVFSLDIPAIVGEIPFSHNDLILWDGELINEFFRGGDVGIPEEANIDGVYLIEDMDEDGVPSVGSGFGAEVLFSLDIPTEINGIAFTEKDIIRCGEPPCSKYHAILSQALGMSVDVDAFALVSDNCPQHHNPEQMDSYPPQGNGCGDACECEGNFDGDQDQDGSDAFTFKVDFGRSPFGNPCIPANPCNGNFNCDEDVDGSDAFIFKEDFGRSPFGNPCPNCVTVPWCE